MKKILQNILISHIQTSKHNQQVLKFNWEFCLLTRIKSYLNIIILGQFCLNLRDDKCYTPMGNVKSTIWLARDGQKLISWCLNDSSKWDHKWIGRLEETIGRASVFQGGSRIILSKGRGMHACRRPFSCRTAFVLSKGCKSRGTEKWRYMPGPGGKGQVVRDRLEKSLSFSERECWWIICGLLPGRPSAGAQWENQWCQPRKIFPVSLFLL